MSTRCPDKTGPPRRSGLRVTGPAHSPTRSSGIPYQLRSSPHSPTISLWFHFPDPVRSVFPSPRRHQPSVPSPTTAPYHLPPAPPLDFSASGAAPLLTHRQCCSSAHPQLSPVSIHPRRHRPSTFRCPSTSLLHLRRPSTSHPRLPEFWTTTFR
jgi:hypothetical protein